MCFWEIVALDNKYLIFDIPKCIVMKTTTTLLISSMVFICCTAIAANTPSSTLVSQFLHPKDWAFEENRGQLVDPSGNSLPEIKFFGSFGGIQIYCTNQKLSFVFTKITQSPAWNYQTKKMGIDVQLPAKSTISASRLDLEFEGANTDVVILSSDKQDITVNYARPNAGQIGINGINFYKTLTYINLYNHIDMIVTANITGLEYEFIVHPGGNPKDIKLARNGADNMEMLTNGGIKYSTAFGALEESRPQSFIGNTTIKSNFIRNGNKLSFKTEEYDKSKDLVIDPGLQWSTYYGSDSDDRAYNIVLDASGNVYIDGFTNSPKGIATKGAYQTSLNGGSDFNVLIAKFSSAGKLIWATYFGGDSGGYSQACAVDNFGNLYVAGYTTSLKGIATKGAYQTSNAGGADDAFLAKFDGSGSLIWSTYFGGSKGDYALGIAVDASSNAYVNGFTASYSGIATKGSFQTSYGGNLYDAFVAKFSESGALDWGTYFGGTGADQGTGIGLDNSNNVYITGVTKSPNGIATKGAYKTNCDINNGNAFLACLDSNGSENWGTYFGGTGGQDIGYALATNGKDKVYFTGVTGNTSNVATSGSGQSSYGGGQSDAFVADFNTNGSINWATYYGGNDFDLAYGISADSSGNIYITGLTYSTDQIATAGGFQTATGSTYYSNAFLAKFNNSSNLRYGTYFGGINLQQGRCVANDNFGDVYIAGITQSSGLATSGAYQTNFGGQNDAFIAKFLLCELTTSVAGLTSACTNSTTSYLASKHSNSNYTWTVSGGTITSGNNTDSITVKWNGSGSGSVAEIETNSLTGCNDTKSLNVTINPTPKPVITGDTVICPLSSSSYHVNSVAGVTYTWNVKVGSITTPAGRDSIEVLWVSPGKGSVSIIESAGGGACKGADTIKVTVAKPLAAVKLRNRGKGLYTFTSIDSTESASHYSWVINGVKIQGAYSTQYNFAHKGSYSISLTVTNAAGCSSTFDSTLNITAAGISERNTDGLNWSVFPNPFKDQLEINYTIAETGPVEISVYDMVGRCLGKLENKILQPGNYKSIFVTNAAHLTEGIYLITIKANGGIETQRIVRVKD